MHQCVRGALRPPFSAWKGAGEKFAHGGQVKVEIAQVPGACAAALLCEGQGLLTLPGPVNRP